LFGVAREGLVGMLSSAPPPRAYAFFIDSGLHGFGEACELLAIATSN
jgi:hypothetical protein